MKFSNCSEPSIFLVWKYNPNLGEVLADSRDEVYTGRFIMLSVITNIYNKKTKGPTLIELFTATGKLKEFGFFFTTSDVRCMHQG